MRVSMVVVVVTIAVVMVVPVAIMTVGRLAAQTSSGCRLSTAATRFAVVYTLQQTSLLWRASNGSAIVLGNVLGLGDIVVLVVTAEFGLDSGRVDAEAVETPAGRLCKLHVLLAVLSGDWEVDMDVKRGNNLGVGKLPDMNVVAADDTFQFLNVLANFLKVDVVGGSLQKDLGGRLRERDGGLEDNESNEQRDGGIGVETARPIGQPDDKSGDNHTDVAKSITNNVKNHGVHSHIAVVVAVPARGLLALLVVIVVDVKAGLASRMLVGGSAAGVLNHVGVVVALRLKQRRLFIRLAILNNGLLNLAFARGRFLSITLRTTGVNNFLAEARRIDADVLNASETRVVSRAISSVLALGSGRCAALGSARRVGLPIEANATGRLRVGTGGGSSDDGFGKNITNVATIIVGSVRDVGAAFLGGVFCRVGVIVSVVVLAVAVIVIVATAVGVAVATEDKEADEVGGKAKCTNNENENRVFDFGRVKESGYGLEDDGDAEGDEEDGVEEGAENLGSQPLHTQVS